MAVRDYSAMIQDLRDTVKWLGTAIATLGSALTGAAAVTRLGTAPEGELPKSIAMLVVALAALLAVAALTAWALSVGEPLLSDLIPEASGVVSQAEADKSGKRREALDKELKKATPVAQLKYENLTDLGAELTRRRDDFRAALASSSSGTIGRAWSKALPELAAALATSYEDLREVSDALRLRRTQRRVAVAIPGVVLAGATIIGAIIPFVLWTKAVPPVPAVRAEAAAITSPVAVNAIFNLPVVGSVDSKGCAPANSTLPATAVGGTWTRPVLILATPDPVANPGLPPTCESGTTWIWRAQNDEQVLITPK